jgi:hypothetical protein
MFASHGDAFRYEESQGGCLQAIQEYFGKRSCRVCSQPFTADGIELIREEAGMVVVKVGCALCGQPLGVALVGMSAAAPTASESASNHCQAKQRAYPADWTKRDQARFSSKPSISYDDVLDAHLFFSALDAGWHKLLPEKRPAIKSYVR